MDLCRLLFKYPGLAKVIYQNVILKGKDKDAMLDCPGDVASRQVQVASSRPGRPNGGRRLHS